MHGVPYAVREQNRWTNSLLHTPGQRGMTIGAYFVKNSTIPRNYLAIKTKGGLRFGHQQGSCLCLLLVIPHAHKATMDQPAPRGTVSQNPTIASTSFVQY